MINFWIAEGVAGFRLDVIDQIAKEPDNGITANGPRLMEFLRELNRETFGGKDLVTVGEAWGADLARARQYSAPDGSVFSMVFQFEQMVLDQDGSKWKARPWALPESQHRQMAAGAARRRVEQPVLEQPRPAAYRQPLG